MSPFVERAVKEHEIGLHENGFVLIEPIELELSDIAWPATLGLSPEAELVDAIGIDRSIG